MIKLYDRNRTYITDIDNHIRVGYEKDFRATWSASLELLANDPVNIMIQPFFMIDIWDDYGEYIGKYRILPKSASVSGNSSTISYNCHHVLHTLLDSTIRKKRYFENTDLPTAIEDILKWQVEKHWVTGNVSSLTKVEGMEMDIQTGLLSPLLELMTHSSVGEYYTYNTLVYPWVLNVAKVTPLNCRIKEGYNMSSFEIETDPTGIVNRVYGYGAIPEESTEENPLPPITVAGINDGREHVEDAESIAKYGVKEYVFTDERYKSDTSLLEAMKYLLKTLSAEVVKVRCTAHDIIKASDKPLSIDEIRMGRTVFFDTEDFGTFEMTITKEGKSDIFGDPTTMEIELSLDYSSMPVTGISRDIQIIKKEIAATQNTVRVAADGKSVVITGPNEPVNPKVGTLWYKEETDLETGLPVYKMYIWDGETWKVTNDEIDKALEELAESKTLIDTVKKQADQLAIDLENGLSTALTEDGILDAINAKANRIIFVAGGDGTHHVLQLTSDGVFIDKGLIQEAHIADGSITDAKIGNLTFDWAEGKTIDAELIRVVNLDANSVTSGKFSGERLEIGSITREHIADGVLDDYTTIQQWNEFLVSYDTFKSEITQTVTNQMGELEQTLKSKIQQQVDSIRLSVSTEVESYVEDNLDRFKGKDGVNFSWNLVKNSKTFDKTKWVKYDAEVLSFNYEEVYFHTAKKESPILGYYYLGELKPLFTEGKEYTISFDVVNSRTDAKIAFGLGGFSGSTIVEVLPSEQKRVSISGVRTADDFIQIHSRGHTLGAMSKFTPSNLKIEEGKVLDTVWSPHIDESEDETKIINEKIGALELNDEKLTARFDNLGGINMLRGSKYMTGWQPVEGASLTETYGNLVPQWNTVMATRISTGTGNKTTARKAVYRFEVPPGLEGRTVTFSMKFYNVRTVAESIEVEGALNGIYPVPAETLDRVVITGIATNATYIDVYAVAAGTGYLFEGISHEAQLEFGSVATPWTPHPTEITTGLVEMTEEGVTVGRLAGEVQTSILYNGVYIQSKISGIPVAEFTEDGTRTPVLYADQIYSDSIVRRQSNSRDVYVGPTTTGDGSGRDSSNRLDSISRALEVGLDFAHFITDYAVINIYVYGTINEIVMITGIAGYGRINIIGMTGQRLVGAIFVNSCTAQVDIKDANVSLDAPNAVNACINYHNSTSGNVIGCTLVGQGDGRGVNATKTLVAVDNTQFFDLSYAVISTDLARVVMSNCAGKTLVKVGTATKGGYLAAYGTRPSAPESPVFLYAEGGEVVDYGPTTFTGGKRPSFAPPTFGQVSKTFYGKLSGVNQSTGYKSYQGELKQGSYDGKSYYGLAYFGTAIRDWLISNGGYSGAVTCVIYAKRNSSSGSSEVSLKIDEPYDLTLPAVRRGSGSSATAGSLLTGYLTGTAPVTLKTTTKYYSDYAGYTSVSIKVSTMKKI